MQNFTYYRSFKTEAGGAKKGGKKKGGSMQTVSSQFRVRVNTQIHVKIYVI